MIPKVLKSRLKLLVDKIKQEARLRERVELAARIFSLLRHIRTWENCELQMPIVARCLKPPREGVAEGAAAHVAARFDGITQDQLTAARDYSADGAEGLFAEVNTYFRKKALKEDVGSLSEKAQKAADELDKMFEEFAGLAEPIRVYRGLGSERVAVETMEGLVYKDGGYSSASSELLPAMVYSGRAQTILVIDLPAGFKAISINEFSRNPQEKEILLPRGVKLKLVDEPKSAKMGFTFLYVEPK